MSIRLRDRLVVRLWLAVVLAVLVLTLLVGWLLRMQAERFRAERLADMPAREVIIRNAQGDVAGHTTGRAVRVPGRGLEFRVTLPADVKGGEQISVQLPPRAPGVGAGAARPPHAPEPMQRGFDRWLLPPVPAAASGTGWAGGRGLALLLIVFAAAVALGSYPVLHKLTQRLQNLQRGVERLGSGDLRARVDESGQDEVAFLAKRFNRAADQIEALVQSQKALLANASHELRSPLTRIRMAVELMEAAGSSSHDKLKDELKRNIAELDALVDEILLASRLEASLASPAVATSPMDTVDMLALCAEEAARMHAQLDWQGSDAALAIIAGDAKLLRRLLRNLLENAQRYGAVSAETPVEIRLQATDKELRIDVLDHGTGVPPEERERIFEPFYRSARASETQGGVGLGLALVRTIAQRHGGSVLCSARSDGQPGAQFTVNLPKA